MAFKCPVCGSEKYKDSSVSGLYECDKCSAVFSDPERFSKENTKVKRGGAVRILDEEMPKAHIEVGASPPPRDKILPRLK